jgi:hypothetical protein
MAVEFELSGEYQVIDASGKRQTLHGPHVTWTTGSQSIHDALRGFGWNGWEICGVAPTHNFARHIVYLKRELPNV